MNAFVGGSRCGVNGCIFSWKGNLLYILVYNEVINLLPLKMPVKAGQIVCPYHGSHEVGKGLEKKIKKDAGIK